MQYYITLNFPIHALKDINIRKYANSCLIFVAFILFISILIVTQLHSLPSPR